MQTLSPARRIEVIDILRGFSLLGIVMVHMVEQYYAGPPPEAITKSFDASIADQIAQGFVGLFIVGKFYMIFSFLFGLSFFIQFSKSDSSSNFLLRFAWRLSLLFGIGMLHHLHYRGDILTIYAVLGFGLLLFYRLPDRALLIIALLLIFNIPSFIVRGIALITPGESNPFNFSQEALMAYYKTLKSGTYLQILTANYHEFMQKMQFQVESGRLYITLGLFLLGLYAGRKKLFENLAAQVPMVRKLIRYSLWTLLGCVVLTAAIFGAVQLIAGEVNQEVGWMVGGLSYDVFNTCLATLYVSWIILLFQREKWRNRLMIFYPVGRMGLTTYLMQTVFGTLIYFSFGLGLVYELGSFYSLALAIAIFVFQIYFSKFWFNYFAMGPVEWLWRSLTYMKIQPLKIRARSVASQVAEPVN